MTTAITTCGLPACRWWTARRASAGAWFASRPCCPGRHRKARRVDAHELHRAVCVNARSSSWPLAARPWARCVCRDSHVASVVDTRERRTHSGPTDRQLQQLPGAGDSQRVRELEPRDKHRADSIPIARHRLRGRFSPTGSFAHPTRTSIASMIGPRAPRRPGKRLSALCKAIHSDPEPSHEQPDT